MSLKTYFTAGGVHTEPLEPHHGVRGVSKGLNLPAHLEEGGGGGARGVIGSILGDFPKFLKFICTKKTNFFGLNVRFGFAEKVNFLKNTPQKHPTLGLGILNGFFWVILIYFVIVIVIIVIVIMYISGVK